MKLNMLFACALLIITAYAGEVATLTTPESSGEALMAVHQGPSIAIRVLLAELPVEESNQLTLSAPEELRVACNNLPGTSYSFSQPLTLTTYQQEVCLNRKKLTPQCMRFTSPSQEILFNGRLYHGDLYLLSWQNKWLMINQLPLEEYTTSVLKTESWPGWPLAYLEIQAVISRTYGLQKILESKRARLPYHLRATNTHQTYSGKPQNPIFSQAVKSTEHLFLVHTTKEGRIAPITAMYDSCCGGVIPAHISGVDFNAAPYLRRTQRCTYCVSCKHYRWEVALHEREIRALLSKIAPTLRKIRSITAVKRDKAGLIQSLKISDGKHTAIVNAQEFYRLMKKIKSKAFKINYRAGLVTFTGKGLGHQLGLCQWGAKAMLDKGFNLHEVFKFYYPGTVLMRLKDIVYIA